LVGLPVYHFAEFKSHSNPPSAVLSKFSAINANDQRPGGKFAMKFLLGLILGILIVPMCLFLYLRSGSAPAAATDAPMPFEKILARGSLHARISKEAPQRDVSTFSTPDLAAGAEIYQKNCAFCHGLPQQSPSAASKGMFPRAPQLFMADDSVTDDPPGVTYWKVRNGIRLTGMPSFKDALTEQQMWQVSALVTRADRLPPDVLLELKPAALPAILVAPQNESAPAAASPASDPAKQK
jgi:thiosulfate dehydrogenase